MDSSDFIKKYYTARRKMSGNQGVFSGRGLVIPVGGAVDGSSDRSNLLGRPRRKISSGDLGSPSQSADSNFSSALGFVNKNVEPPKLRPMFPEQEDSEGNNYNEGDSLRLTEEILHESLSDEAEVESTGRSLVETCSRDVDDLLNEINLDTALDYAERGLSAVGINIDIPDVDEDLVKTAFNVGGEIVRDTTAAAVASLPVIGTGAAAAFVYTNMRELRAGQSKAISEIDDLVSRGTVADRDALLKVADNIYDDYIDMMQAIVLLVPIIGPTKGFFSIIRSTLTMIKQGRATTLLGLGGSGIGAAVRSQILGSGLFKFITRYVDSGLTSAAQIDRSSLLKVVKVSPATLVLIADLVEDFDDQKEAWDGMGTQDRIASFGQDAAQEFRYNPARFGFDSQDGDESTIKKIRELISDKIDSLQSENILSEGRSVVTDDEKILRQYIRETIYHSQVKPLYPAQPAGYEYRDPAGSDEFNEAEGFEDLTASSNAVNVKTDSGQISYSPRPRDLKEEALRRIIARKIQEQKKRS